jgi:ubiquinone/menaquinone biosynthesis C-methylase UbiE
LFRDELDQKPYDRSLLDEFSRYFAPASVIHDVGCGPTGHISRYLQARGLHVIGSDISGKCIEIASACHPEMEFLVMDMANLKLDDQSIDGIVSYYSIIHTPKRSIPAIFQEFRRVLKKKGKLLVSVKGGDQEGYLQEFLGFRTRVYFTHFQKEEIARFLTENGFGILSLESRNPLEGEIAVPRIFALGEKQ